MKERALFETKKLVICTDGGSRGNPGPSALGVVVGDREYSQFLGNMTNNQAEYHAVIFALKKAKQLMGKKKTKEMDVEVRMDSELIVKQLNAEYKIEDPDLQPLFLKVWNLRFDFKSIVFKHVPREQNKAADRLVNRALDANT